MHGRLLRFLPAARRSGAFEVAFEGTPAIKDPIEAAGVPHKEVGRVLIDGREASLSTRVRGGEAIDVFAVERQCAGDPPRLLLDVHLGRPARMLRLIGIDAAYEPHLDDDALQARAAGEGRVLLTRDIGLLKRTDVPAGAFVHATSPREQLVETVWRFGLADHTRPYSRCSHCNVPVADVDAADVEAEVPPRVRARVSRFRRCPRCGRVYWRGTHEAGLHALMAAAGIDFELPGSPPSSLPAPSRYDE